MSISALPTTPRRIVIIDGHPDAAPQRLCHALAAAYAEGARAAGREVTEIRVADLDFPLLRTQAEFEHGEPPTVIQAAQRAIEAAEHLLIVYPLWMGSMPALLKGFIEQVFRPGFAMGDTGPERTPWSGRLGGRSARVVVTMGMPGFIYRWFYRAHSLKSLERNILRFCGIGPVKDTLVGGVDGAGEADRSAWLEQMRTLGRRGI